MKRRIKKVYNRLPPHTYEAHPVAEAGEANKPFIIAIIAVVAIVALSLLLLFSDQLVGKALYTGQEGTAGLVYPPKVYEMQDFTVQVKAKVGEMAAGVEFELTLPLGISCKSFVENFAADVSSFTCDPTKNTITYLGGKSKAVSGEILIASITFNGASAGKYDFKFSKFEVKGPAPEKKVIISSSAVSATSQLEVKTPACGDGNVNQMSEQCDDGNTINKDGCSAACQKEEALPPPPPSGPEAPPAICDDANPSLCTTQTTCTGANNYWTNSACHDACVAGYEDPNNDKVCTPVTEVCDDAHSSLCTTQAACINANNYWYTKSNFCYDACPYGSEDPDNDKVCTAVAGVCDDANPSLCTTQTACTSANNYWSNNACYDACPSGTEDPNNDKVCTATAVCDDAHPNLCNTQNACTAAMNFWYNNMCYDACPMNTEDPNNDKVCTPVAAVCDDAHPSLCTTQTTCTGANNYWSNNACYDACPSGTEDPNSDKVCTSVTPSQQVCTPYQYYCDSSTATKQCRSDGSGYNAPVNCAVSQVCQEGVCAVSTTGTKITLTDIAPANDVFSTKVTATETFTQEITIYTILYNGQGKVLALKSEKLAGLTQGQTYTATINYPQTNIKKKSVIVYDIKPGVEVAGSLEVELS